MINTIDTVAAVILEKIIEDESWQGNYTDKQRQACIIFASMMLKIAVENGADLDLERKRLIEMFKAGKLKNEESDQAT